MRREEDGRAAIAGLAHEAEELVLHQGVEPVRRLVEDEQLRVREEREQEGDLPAVARRELAHPTAEVEVEALRELVPATVVEAASDMPDRGNELADGPSLGEPELARDIGEAGTQRRSVAARIAAQDLDVSRGRSKEIEQAPDRGRLAGAVRTEEPEHLAAADLEIDARDGPDWP